MITSDDVETEMTEEQKNSMQRWYEENKDAIEARCKRWAAEVYEPSVFLTWLRKRRAEKGGAKSLSHREIQRSCKR